MSFTIIAALPETNELGIASSAGIPCSGMLIAHGRPGVGLVATLGWADFGHALMGLDLLADGRRADDVMKSIVGEDPGQSRRQLIVAEVSGGMAIHSGVGLDDWKGHHEGRNFVAAGNYLSGPEPVDAMVDSFEHAKGRLAERLLVALDAGQRVGADRRGKTSAVLLVLQGRQYPPLSVRIDYSLADNAVTELQGAYKAFIQKTYPLFPRFDWPEKISS